MLLSDINRYFATHQRACLSDLINHFDVDAEAIKPMLAMLAAKGRIAPITTSNNCGGCTKCDPNGLVIYEWVARS
jgi:hypothetical protein